MRPLEATPAIGQWRTMGLTRAVWATTTLRELSVREYGSFALFLQFIRYTKNTDLQRREEQSIRFIKSIFGYLYKYFFEAFIRE